MFGINMQDMPPSVPLYECQTLEDHVVAAAMLARPCAARARSPSSGPQIHSSRTPDHWHAETPDSLARTSVQGENSIASMSAPQLYAASRALLLAATAAECMCDAVVVPTFSDSLISWLLRMPNQCALAVLLSRPDLSLEDVCSPNHALRCSRSDSTVAHRSALGTEPSVFHESEPQSPSGSEADEPFADSDDPGQLWLQVRYLAALLRNGDLKQLDGPENGKLDDPLGGPKHQKVWVLYLSQLLRLALIAAEGQWDHTVATFCIHERYGPQTLVKGFNITEEWMAPEFINALWHCGVLMPDLGLHVLQALNMSVHLVENLLKSIFLGGYQCYAMV